MTPPFTAGQFFDVFVRYNEAVWPAPYVLAALGFLAVLLALSRWRHRGRVVAGLVGLLWLWTGVVYHWMHFTSINRAAWIFGAFFVLQAVLLCWVGVVRDRIRFGRGWGFGRIAGSVVICYALVVYPALGYLLGHRYPAAPTFGAPCPIALSGVLRRKDAKTLPPSAALALWSAPMRWHGWVHLISAPR